jgi:BASS family bile acid:Na+ symporter
MVARVVGISVLAPLALGMLLRYLWPAFAGNVSRVASAVGTLVLVAALIVALIAVWPVMSSFAGDGALLACVAFAVIGLAVGHVLGGPDADDRTVLALATAARHPGVAIAIGAAVFPDEKAVPAAVVLYLLVSAVVSAPYVAWRKRLHGRRVASSPA